MAVKTPLSLWLKVLFWICKRFKFECQVVQNTPDYRIVITVYRKQK